MPNILSSTALRNGYNDVSSFCHLENKPVFITRNGQGDLAVMSIELCERLMEKYELYKELEKGINSIKDGRTYSAEEVFEELDKILEK